MDCKCPNVLLCSWLILKKCMMYEWSVEIGAFTTQKNYCTSQASSYHISNPITTVCCTLNIYVVINCECNSKHFKRSFVLFEENDTVFVNVVYFFPNPFCPSVSVISLHVFVYSNIPLAVSSYLECIVCGMFWFAFDGLCIQNANAWTTVLHCTFRIIVQTPVLSIVRSVVFVFWCGSLLPNTAKCLTYVNQQLTPLATCTYCNIISKPVWTGSVLSLTMQ